MPLTAPVLTSGPADGSTTTQQTASFAWNAVAGATGYKLSVDGGGGSSGAGPPSQVGILIFENESATSVASGNNPTFHSLQAQYRDYSNFFAATHPSLPNYCAETSGSLLGKDGSDSGTIGFAGAAPNIFHQLELAGKTWRTYEEGGGGRLSQWINDHDVSPFYASRHCPGAFYGTTQTIGSGGNGRYDFTKLLTDITGHSLPDFFYITPNLRNDGHNTSVPNADQWLAGQNPNGSAQVFTGITNLIAAMRPDGVLFLTFDEGSGTGAGQRIYTVCVGQRVTHDTVSTTQSHYSLLYGIQQSFGQQKFTEQGQNLASGYTSLSAGAPIPQVGTGSSGTIDNGTTRTYTTATLPLGGHDFQVWAYDGTGDGPHTTVDWQIAATAAPAVIPTVTVIQENPAWTSADKEIGRVDAICYDPAQNIVYVGGNFHGTNSIQQKDGTKVSQDYLFAIDWSTQELISAWRPQPNGRIYTIHVSADGSQVFVGGDFTTIGSSVQTRHNFACLNPATGNAGTVNTTRVADLNFNASVRRIAVTQDEHTMFLGGNFTAPATTGTRLCKLDLTPAAATIVGTWKPSTNDQVKALAIDPATNRLVVGGDWTQLNGAAVNYVGCIRQDSNGETLAWAYHPGDRVLDMASDGTNVYFGTVSDLLVKCDIATGTQQWGAKAEDTDGNVQAVCLNGSYVVGGMHGDCVGNSVGAASGAYSGGSCGVATGIVRHKVWRQTAASGALDTAWDPSLTSTAGVLGVWALAAFADVVWMGGDFTKTQGVTRQRLAAFGTITAPPPPPPAGVITPRVGVGFGEGTTSAAAAPPPTYASGDLLVAHVTAVGAVALTAPAGWTLASPVTADGTLIASAVYTKTATTETTATFTCAGAASMTVYITAWKNAVRVRSSGAAHTTAGGAVTVTSPVLTGLIATDEVLTFAATTSGPRPYPDAGGLLFGAMDAPTDWSTQTGIAAIESVAGRPLAAAHSMVPWNCAIGQTGDFTGGAKAPAVDYAHNRLTYTSWPRPRPGALSGEPSWQSIFGTGSDPITGLNAINAGTYDTLIDNNATAYKAFGHPIICRLLWEPNGGGIIWGIGMSSQQSAYANAYILACQRIISRTNAIAKNVYFHWNPQNFQTVAGVGGSRDSMYWGDTSTSFAGTETYITSGTLAQVMTETSSNGQTYLAIYSGYGLGSGHAKILGNGEGGNRWNSDDAAAAARIDSYRTDFPSFPDWRFFMWWNGVGSNGNSDITSQPTVCKTAFSTWLAQAYTKPRLSRSYQPISQPQVYEDRRTLGSTGACYGAGMQGATLMHATSPGGDTTAETFTTYGYGAQAAITLALTTDAAPPPPPASATATDTFTRTTTNGWGTADTGQAWKHEQGTTANASTTGTKGSLAFPVNDTMQEALAPDAGVNWTDTDITASFVWDVDAGTSASFFFGLLARYVDQNNYYRTLVRQLSGANTNVRFVRRVAGIETTIGAVTLVPALTLTAGTTYKVRFKVDVGGALHMKVWDAAGAEPGAYTYEQTPGDDPITSGGIGVRCAVSAGGVPTPTFLIDSFTATGTSAVAPPPPAGNPPATPTFLTRPDDSTVADARWAVQFDSASTSAEYLLQGTGTSTFDDGWKPLTYSPTTFQASFETFTVSAAPETLTFSVRSSNANGTSGIASDDWNRLEAPPPPPPGHNLGGPTSQWLYDAPNYVGCQWGVGPGPQKTKAAETFANRLFYLRTQGDGEAAFNPTGKNAAGSQVETAVDWSNDFADMAGTGTDLNHPVDVVFTIIGKRSSDLTWPAAVGGDPWGAFSAWVYGDGSYVDTCITAWANLIKTVPRAAIGRMWHEFGNATTTYGQGTDAQFVTYWRKVVQRLRDLGALTLDPTDQSNEQMRIAWNPASHLNNPNDDASHHPGNAWVDWNLIDLYFKPTTSDNLQDFHPFYDSWNSINGTRNPEHRPLLLAEHGFLSTDTNRLNLFSQWLNLLKTVYNGVNAVMWWDGSSNDVTDVPAGFQQAWRVGLADPYFLPDGIVTPINPPPPPPVTPTVSVSSPISGTTITGSAVNVTVQASEQTGGISAVTMSVNQGAVQPLSASSVDAQGNGSYIGTAALTTAAAPGASNTIDVTAVDKQIPAASTTAPTVTVLAVTPTTDSTGPTFTINNPPSGNNLTVVGANGTVFTITGIVTDPSGIQSLVATYPDLSAHATTPAGDGSFSYTASLTTGANAFSLVATDNAVAHNQTTKNFTITLNAPGGADTTPPTLAVTSPAANITIAGNAGDTYQVAGVATDSSGIAGVTIQGLGVPVGGSGQFSTPVSLVIGANVVTVVATDASVNSNQTTIVRTITLVATLGPTLTVTQPATNLTIIGADGYLYQVSGTVTSTSGLSFLTVNNVDTLIASDGSFSQIIALALGQNTVTVRAVDTQTIPQQTVIQRVVTLQSRPSPFGDQFALSEDQIRVAEQLQERGVE